jgi:hypothetical protein
MTLCEALEVVRRLTPEDARREAADTPDPMLRSVCAWRSEAVLHDKFDQLLRAARCGPCVAVGSGNTILDALHTGPQTFPQLKGLGFTTDSVSTAICRLRKKGHHIDFVRSGRDSDIGYFQLQDEHVARLGSG